MSKITCIGKRPFSLDDIQPERTMKTPQTQRNQYPYLMMQFPFEHSVSSGSPTNWGWMSCYRCCDSWKVLTNCEISWVKECCTRGFGRLAQDAEGFHVTHFFIKPWNYLSKDFFTLMSTKVSSEISAADCQSVGNSVPSSALRIPPFLPPFLPPYSFHFSSYSSIYFHISTNLYYSSDQATGIPSGKHNPPAKGVHNSASADEREKLMPKGG